MKLAFVLFTFLVSKAQAVDFCHTTQSFNLYSEISTLKQNIASIQKTDLVLTSEQKITLNDALKQMGENQIKTKVSFVDEINNKANYTVDVLLAPVTAAINKADVAITKDVAVDFEPGADITKSINAAMTTFSSQMSGVNPKLSMFEQAKDKAVRMKTSTQFFEKITALLNQLSEKLKKQCVSENFNFSTTLSDGKRYLFSDCLDTVGNNLEADAFGGKITANQCRYILECNKKEASDKTLFMGFSFQWILECKKEEGKCPGATLCAQRIDGGGNATIKQPDVPGGRVDR